MEKDTIVKIVYAEDYKELEKIIDTKIEEELKENRKLVALNHAMVTKGDKICYSASLIFLQMVLIQEDKVAQEEVIEAEQANEETEELVEEELVEDVAVEE